MKDQTRRSQAQDEADEAVPEAAANKKARDGGQLKRRGLLAAAIALGAGAVAKLAGPDRAEAAAQALLFPGAPGDLASTNTSYNVTNLNAGATFASSPVLDVDATAAPSGFKDAIYARAGGTNSWGVLSVGSAGASGYGVLTEGGDASGAGAGAPGVRATGGTASSGNGGAGVRASGGSSSSGTGGAGVSANGGGSSSGPDGPGVLGTSGNGAGVQGASTSGVGLRGLSSGFVGLVGISDTSIGLYGYNVSPGVPAFYAENLGPSNRIAGLFNGDVQVLGNFSVTGAKAAAVTLPDGSQATMYSQESPEPYFEDFGRAQLVAGVAKVALEPEFASLVRRDDYMVFLTPAGDSRGLYVSRQDAAGFEIREAQGGTSSLAFTYRVVAKRKDIPGKRLERMDAQTAKNIADLRKDLAKKASPRAGVLGAGVVDIAPPPEREREERPRGPR